MLLLLLTLGLSLSEAPQEINETEIRRAEEVFRYPLREDASVIVSMRWSRLDEQISHFLFGAAIAYALNRSLKVEMRRYPLHKKQPEFQFRMKGIIPERVELKSFARLRVARELFCKTQKELEGNSSVPILIRNYDDISSLYGNHFIGGRLTELFGIHAGYFLLRHYIDLPEVKSGKGVLGVEVQSFDAAQKMGHMRNAKLLAANFSKAIESLTSGKKNLKVHVMTNDTEILKHMKSLRQLPNNIEGFAKLVNAEYFLGTYRSKVSTLVNLMRGKKSLLLNTDNGNVLQMSNYQAGILSPFDQNVEEFEFTVNEKLRMCSDNLENLRTILHHFVL